MSSPGPVSIFPDGESPDGHGGPPGNGLDIEGPPWELEKISDYDQGGHHPVHLGDLLHQRYKVLYKLGNGGFANVWLCHDTLVDCPRYVALKIMMADASSLDCPELRMSELTHTKSGKELSDELFCLPLDRFEIYGFNGVHYVFVYSVLGPRVASMPKRDSKPPRVPYQDICSQVTHAMTILHERGICHGDFRPANILTRLSGLEDLDEDRLSSIIGTPRTTRVTTREGEAHDLSSAPQYLVYPLDWEAVASSEVGASLITHKVCITDFGESYEVSPPPPDLGIPMAYCSPEYGLEGTSGTSSDIWALACTLFEIRLGKKLFAMFEEELDEHLFIIATVLGKFPEPWWSAT